MQAGGTFAGSDTELVSTRIRRVAPCARPQVLRASAMLNLSVCHPRPCGLRCGPHANVHVGLQAKRQPTGLVRADAAEAEWTTEIATDNGDFRGPAVQGKKGERFVYLTWGSAEDGSFNMFRRAKLMLADLRRARRRSPWTSLSPTSTECLVALD